MSWRSINWYEVDAEEFYEAVEQVVETYAAAEKHISRTVAERLSAADQNVKKARTEEDSYLAHQLRDYEESVGARRTALLAGMAFSTLVALFLGTLGQLHKRLASNRKSIHETRVRAKTKIVWVAKFAQFGIDLHDGPTPLPYFEELLYARDSFLHEPICSPIGSIGPFRLIRNMLMSTAILVRHQNSLPKPSRR